MPYPSSCFLVNGGGVWAYHVNLTNGGKRKAMPYPDDYVSRGAPDDGARPFELPDDHPFRGWSEGSLTKLAKSLVATRRGVLGLSVTVMDITDGTIREHLEGYLTEMMDYLDILNRSLDEAFESFGD